MILGMSVSDTLLEDMIAEAARIRREAGLVPRRYEVGIAVWAQIEKKCARAVPPPSDDRAPPPAPFPFVYGSFNGVLVHVRLDLDPQEWALVYRA